MTTTLDGAVVAVLGASGGLGAPIPSSRATSAGLVASRRRQCGTSTSSCIAALTPRCQSRRGPQVLRLPARRTAYENRRRPTNDRASVRQCLAKPRRAWNTY